MSRACGTPRSADYLAAGLGNRGPVGPVPFCGRFVHFVPGRSDRIALRLKGWVPAHDSSWKPGPPPCGEEGFPMSKEALRRAAAIGAVLALGAAPAALAARPDDPGSQGQGHGQGDVHGKGATKGVSYVFKGTYAGAGSVDVDHGNAHVRKAGLVDTPVSFDLSSARIVVVDTNADGTADANDIAADDRVVVKARLPRKDPSSQPYG